MTSDPIITPAPLLHAPPSLSSPSHRLVFQWRSCGVDSSLRLLVSPSILDSMLRQFNCNSTPMCLCVCVRACVRVRDRERRWKRERERPPQSVQGEAAGGQATVFSPPPSPSSPSPPLFLAASPLSPPITAPSSPLPLPHLLLPTERRQEEGPALIMPRPPPPPLPPSSVSIYPPPTLTQRHWMFLFRPRPTVFSPAARGPAPSLLAAPSHDARGDFLSEFPAPHSSP